MDNPIKGQSYKVNASRGLNLRMEPNTGSQIILAMPKGSVVTLAGTEVHESNGHTWYNVTYDDKTGWAASEYLEPDRGIISDEAVEVVNVKYNGRLQYDRADLQRIPDPVNRGAITYSIKAMTDSTSLDAWKVAAGKDKSGKDKYPIPKPN